MCKEREDHLKAGQERNAEVLREAGSFSRWTGFLISPKMLSFFKTKLLKLFSLLTTATTSSSLLDHEFSINNLNLNESSIDLNNLAMLPGSRPRVEFVSRARFVLSETFLMEFINNSYFHIADSSVRYFKSFAVPGRTRPSRPVLVDAASILPRHHLLARRVRIVCQFYFGTVGPPRR